MCPTGHLCKQFFQGVYHESSKKIVRADESMGLYPNHSNCGARMRGQVRGTCQATPESFSAVVCVDSADYPGTANSYVAVRRSHLACDGPEHRFLQAVLPGVCGQVRGPQSAGCRERLEDQEGVRRPYAESHYPSVWQERPSRAPQPSRRCDLLHRMRQCRLGPGRSRRSRISPRLSDEVRPSSNLLMFNTMQLTPALSEMVGVLYFVTAA